LISMTGMYTTPIILTTKRKNLYSVFIEILLCNLFVRLDKEEPKPISLGI
jgi:hypothetical protein